MDGIFLSEQRETVFPLSIDTISFCNGIDELAFVLCI